MKFILHILPKEYLNPKYAQVVKVQMYFKRSIWFLCEAVRMKSWLNYDSKNEGDFDNCQDGFESRLL